MKIKNFFKSMIVALAILLSINTYATKHVLYMDNVVNTTQTFCISVGIDSFVVYTPNSFISLGPTSWEVDWTGYVAGCDSMILIPNVAKNYFITCVSNTGSPVSFNLKLFSAPPPHADFSLFFMGNYSTINLAKDTVWSCSDSIHINSNVIVDDATSWLWTGPGGYSSTNPNAWLTAGGMHIFERSDPCGTTRDTLVIIKLPFILPTLSDSSFCNTPVDITLDPGPGWNYLWTGGATTQTLHVNTAGVYTVNLSNICTNNNPFPVTVQIESGSLPIPNITGSQAFYCADTVIVLDPSPGYLYDTYDWSTGATTSTINVTGTGFYEVTVTKGACNAYSAGWYDFYDVPPTPQICIVTVDVSLNKNMVVWTADYEPDVIDHTYSPMVGYNIYKAVGFNSWQLLSTVSLIQDHSFIDATSNPPMVSALYKIAMVDECGVESTKSWYHKTILLSVTQGANPGQIPLLWSPYTDESGTFQVDKYFLYRGDSPSTMILYDSIPGYNTSYVDTGVYVQKYYQIGVSKVGGCNPAPAFVKGGSKSITTGSYSNVTNNTVTGISEQSVSTLSTSVYPNPSSDGVFYLKGDRISFIEVTDIQGQVILTLFNTSIIDLSVYSSGMYFARVTNEERGSQVHKLIIK